MYSIAIVGLKRSIFAVAKLVLLNETEGKMGYKFHMLIVYCCVVKVDQLGQYRDGRRDSGLRTFRLRLIQTFCG